jgi:hypothetical protein
MTIRFQTALGQAIVDERPDVRLPCPPKKPRLSVLNVALLMGSSFVFSQPVSLSFIVPPRPPPTLRDFPWLVSIRRRLESV